MKFQSAKLCLMVSAAVSLVACQNEIQSRQANHSNGIPVKAVAQAQLLDLSGTLDEFLKSEMKIEDIKAAIEKLTADLSENVDTNSDDELDVEELANSDLSVEDVQAKVEALDIDKDGYISSEEMSLIMVKWQDKIKAAKEAHREKFAEKRQKFCDMLQDRIVNAKDDKFLEAILMKNGLAKCAGVIADEDSDDIDLSDDMIDSVDSNDSVVDDTAVDADATDEDDTVVAIVAPPAPTLPPADAVCKSVNTIQISVTQDSKSIMDILIKICQR